MIYFIVLYHFQKNMSMFNKKDFGIFEKKFVKIFDFFAGICRMGQKILEKILRLGYNNIMI